MLYAAKIDDRHLSEQKLLEMAAFYTWLDFTLTIFHAAVLHSNEKRRGGNAAAPFGALLARYARRITSHCDTGR